MQPKCIAAVNKVAGRKLTDAQIAAIDDRLQASMRRLARSDPQWQSLTTDQRMRAAAESAMSDIRAEADRRFANAERQILKQAETNSRVQTLQDSFTNTPGHNGTRAEALKRDFELTHTQIAAERKIAMGGLMDLIEAAGDKKNAGLGRKFLMTVFDVENPRMTLDVIREIYQNANGHTGNSAAIAAARSWLDTIEGLRMRFNAAGGDVGRLENGYVPQPHDTTKVRKAGAGAWASFVAPRVDRSRYLHEDGSRMNDADVHALLRKAWQSIATEGLNKRELGAYRSDGKRADRGSQSRQVHFADGDAWAEYMREFGRGSVYDAMMQHISGITRDITLIERYGPDANANARLQFDQAAVADGTQPDKLVGPMSISPQTFWNMITGKVGTPVDETLARTFQTVRDLQGAAKLGKAVVSSITDLDTLVRTTGYNRLPYWQLFKDIGSQASKETRDFLTTHGMIAESIASSLNRWSGDHLGSNWSGRLTNAVLRWSFLNAWTDGLRQGFTMSMNAGLARMAKSGWADLSEWDRSRLTRAGIGEADWGVLNGVQPTLFKGRELLTPQSIKESSVVDADALAAKVFGFIHDESEYAVVNPDLHGRAITTIGGLQAGTWAGETARTAMQFKSFPIAMITRHWARMLEGDHNADGAPLLANRSVTTFALLVSATGLGAIALQAKQLLQGKDPIDMEKGRFWAKALAQGGGLSIAGDLFLVDPASSRGDTTATLAKNIAGPAFGSLAGDLLARNIIENLWQAAEGKDTHWEAEWFSWAKSETPGANLWWLQPMIEHGFTNAMNESLSPGYLSRMQQRAQKDFGQQYWWAPRDALPRRAPDLERAVGR